MTKMKKIFLFIGFFALLIPIANSDGGCIKVADDVLVQLSSAPEVPRAYQQVSYLFSFGNKQGLSNREINGTLKIVKNDETFFTKTFRIKDGILDLKHTFKSPGLYEIFLDFQIGNKNYKPEYFLVEVIEQKNIEQKNYFVNKVIFLIIGIIFGALLMKFYTKKYKSKK